MAKSQIEQDGKYYNLNRCDKIITYERGQHDLAKSQIEEEGKHYNFSRRDKIITYDEKSSMIWQRAKSNRTVNITISAGVTKL